MADFLNADTRYTGNFNLTDGEFCKAEKILNDLQDENERLIEEGYGPFLAAIYDKDGNLIAKSANTVVKDSCCLWHAEMNTIKLACKNVGSYDLSPLEATMYVTAEPCIMCAGAIMWSGIKSIFYGVSSKDVEEITGFDEGFKPDWIREFAARGIRVCGGITEERGKEVLRKYVDSSKEIYKPSAR